MLRKHPKRNSILRTTNISRSCGAIRSSQPGLDITPLSKQQRGRRSNNANEVMTSVSTPNLRTGLPHNISSASTTDSEVSQIANKSQENHKSFEG